MATPNKYPYSLSDLRARYDELSKILISKQTPQGYWEGHLSSSALSTAVAIVAFKISGERTYENAIKSGLQWMYRHINADNGYGDTPESKSNVSTTLLSYAAIYYCKAAMPETEKILEQINQYLQKQNIQLSATEVTKSVLAFYGKDLTFSVPILTMLALCGVTGHEAFEEIPQLPFELTLFPPSFYQFLNLQVVSYAIPALVGVGIAIFKKKKKPSFLLNTVRKKSIPKALKRLQIMLPESGGFLEAIPLTAFVSMCLISSGLTKSPVVTKGLHFLKAEQRHDGSWPIDTNLATWVTTLSIKALDKGKISPTRQTQLRTHLLNTQYQTSHPFNQARPGGWGWTHLSGAVPDADDTSGATLALLKLYTGQPEEIRAIIAGCQWLRHLQNRDGGTPTFSKGWGKLPFDFSSADITAHALWATCQMLHQLSQKLTNKQRKQFIKSTQGAIAYLAKVQSRKGSFTALWFGNQHTSQNHNPIYGTGRVTSYLQNIEQLNILTPSDQNTLSEMIRFGKSYILSRQNTDGSWGGGQNLPGTIEETSIALCALADAQYTDACQNGFKWLKQHTSTNSFPSAPIGLYFAALWYDEQLYPLTFYMEALKKQLESIEK